MKTWINTAFKSYLKVRYRYILHFMEHPHEVQSSLLRHLIDNSKHTVWGKMHGYQQVRSYEDFVKKTPICDYDFLKPYIERMMHGERDVLWSGQTKMFAKSSGTTSDKSKFIPVSPQHLKKCLLKGSWDSMTVRYHQLPDSKIFTGKGLVMGGSLLPFEPYPKTMIGDVSAFMLQNIPSVGRPFYAPDFDTALMSNWDEKIERMAHILTKENMVLLAGVPTWTIILLRRVLELSGKKNLLEVWPNVETYIHGGVNFEPYREQFQQLLPSSHINYQEIYNASEGFFAIQDNFESDDMLLLLDNGIFYELLPASEWEKPNPQAIPLEAAQAGEHYALVISTNSGLWRYMPGDTVVFTSTKPYRIRLTGRTKQFVNAFGEEVMVSNTDKAIAETCRQTEAIVAEYTVAPIYFSASGKAGHEWLVEFDRPPADIEVFQTLLDNNLQRANSDYEAKRFKSMALERLCLRILPRGTFHNWLRMKGKFGGQHKVPRLANHRKYVDEILSLKTP